MGEQRDEGLEEPMIELLEEKGEALVAEVVEYPLEALLGKILKGEELDMGSMVLEEVDSVEVLELVVNLEMLLEALLNVVGLALEAPDIVLDLGDVEAELGAAVRHSEVFVVFDAIDVAFAHSVLEVILGRESAVSESVSLLEGLVTSSVVRSVVGLVGGLALVLVVSVSEIVFPGTKT